MIDTLFWAAVVLVVYAYAGYPCVLAAIAHVRRREIRRAPAACPVSFIITAHNEAGRILATVAEMCAYFERKPYSFEIIVSADGNDAIQVDFIETVSNSLRVSSWGGSLNESITGCFNVGTGARNAVAVTIVEGRIDAAANGSTAITASVDSLDRPVGNPLVAVVVDALVQALVSITLYAPLPDTAGLSALSEIS